MNPSQVRELKEKFASTATGTDSVAELKKLKADYIGPKGSVTAVLKGLKDADPALRKELGQVANEVRQAIEDLFQERTNLLERAVLDEKLKHDWIDFSALESNRFTSLHGGGMHPILIVQREIEEIFLSMGFEVLDGPHVEDDFHNFEALNIPADHPARDMQDTFWFSDRKHLLRTHTSTIQVRGMESHKPPFQFVGPGKVFRCERTDASHEMAFHQLEGMMVDRDISVAHLIYFMKTLLKEIFQREVKVRLRPGFFPFVEPGFELDVNCLICDGRGCSVCKQTGWVELLPCGMVHPNVLRAGSIDPQQYSGFAFGLGLDRLVMMRYGIDDIRLIHSCDLRFVSQFKSF